MSDGAGSTHVGYDLTDAQDREDRRKHLELVSAVIARMSSSSGTAKGWTITLAGAAFGIALVRDSWYLIALGLVGVAAFGLLDVFYLSTEKNYRNLYVAIAEDNVIAPFSMKTRGVASDPKVRSYLSWSILFFYVPIMLVGAVFMVVAAVGSSPSTQEPKPHGQSHHDNPGRPGLDPAWP